DSTIVSEFLSDKFEICVRSGLHCSPLKYRSLGTTEQGTVRVSISYFTTEEEIMLFCKAIKYFIKTYEI
ncbi:MAG: aminotransferase class V-fold PLP-dependent enzyme, partial [Eubacteriales bacterium]|nr:aminotransferase class V-fold PLP-dependent enzyme [Eubacteriales bacterium]